MKWRLVRILLAISLTISIVSLIAWPFSYFCVVHVARTHIASSHHVWTAGGRLSWLRQSGPGVAELRAANSIEPRSWLVQSSRYRARHYDAVDRWNNLRESLRFHTARSSLKLPSGRVINRRYTAIPFWPIAWLFAMPPAVAYPRHRVRQKRIRDGLCARCGYDLRASGDRCPECGTARAPR